MVETVLPDITDFSLDLEDNNVTDIPKSQPQPEPVPLQRQHDTNPFDAYDQQAPLAITQQNYFDTFDNQDQQQTQAPFQLNKPQAGPDNWFVKDFKDAVKNQEDQSFMDGVKQKLIDLGQGLKDPQQYKETVKAFPGGVISFTGTAAEGVAGLQTTEELHTRSNLSAQLELMDRVDRGEHVSWMEDYLHYQDLSPEARKERRAEILQRLAEPVTKTKERTFYQTGAGLVEYGQNLFPAKPGYEQSVGRLIGGGLGSVVAGGALSWLAGPLASGTFFGVAGSGEAVQRAIQYSDAQEAAGGKPLTEEQLATVALIGVAPGMTDSLPIEFLLGRFPIKIPIQVRSRVAKYIATVGGQAFFEGVQEGGQAYIQNIIAQQVYNEKQDWTQGIAPEAGVGGAVGAISAVGHNLLLGFAGRHHVKVHTQKDGTVSPQDQIKAAGDVIDKIQEEQAKQAEEAAKEAAKQQPSPTLSPEAQEAFRQPPAPEATPTQPTPEPAATELQIGSQANVVSAEDQSLISDKPLTVRDIVDDPEHGKYVFFEGSETGFPIDQVQPVAAEVGLEAQQQPASVEQEAARTAATAISDQLTDADIQRIIQGDQQALAQAVSRSLSEEQVAQVQQLIAAQRPDIASQFRNLIARSQFPADARIADQFSVFTKDVAQVASEVQRAQPEQAGQVIQNAIGKLSQKYGIDQKIAQDIYGAVASQTQGLPVSDIVRGVSDVVRQRLGRLGIELPNIDVPSEVAAQEPSLEQQTLRNLFANLINSKTPQSQWADRLGVSEQALAPLIDEAVQKGWLTRTAEGKLRRAPKTARTGHLAPMIVKDAVPDIIPGEGFVAKTDAALDRWDAIKATVMKVAKRILPDDVYVDFVDTIEIAELKKEDTLLALRSKVLTDAEKNVISQVNFGVSYEPATSGVTTGREGGVSVEKQSTAGVPSITGEGIAPSASGNLRAGLPADPLARIVRQFSASLDENGNVIVGRQSREGRAARKGAKGNVAQRVGTTESFKVGSRLGGVKAEVLEDQDIREGNLARLTYKLDGETDASPLAELNIVQRYDGAWEVDSVTVNAPRRGIGTQLYNAVEKDLGVRMSPSGVLSPDGIAFWQKRSPASVQWHVQTPTFRPYYFSPAKIESEINRIRKEIRDISFGIGNKRKFPADLKQQLLDGYRAELRQLKDMWGKLPEEARAAKESMFALRAWHASPYDFSRFDINRIGTGEGAQAFGHGLYFAEKEGTGRYYLQTFSSRAIPESVNIDGKNVKLNNETMQWLVNQLYQDRSRSTGGVFEGDIIDRYIESLQNDIADGKNADGEKYTSSEIAEINDAIAFLDNLYEKKVEFPENMEGVLYEVEIDVNKEDLLDWDKPLSQQSDKIKSALAKLGIEAPSQNDVNAFDDALLAALQSEETPALPKQPKDPSGADIVRQLHQKRGSTWLDPNQSAEKAAAEELRNAGIPGIRYLDQGSRTKTSVPLLDGKEVAGNPALDTAGAALRRNNGSTEAAAIELEKNAKGFKYPPSDMLDAVKLLRDGRVSLGEASVTHNFVIFDDKLVKITKKNGKPVTDAERQSVVDQMYALRGFYSPAIRAAEQITQQMRASVLEGQPLAATVRPGQTQPEALGRTDPYNQIISLSMRAIEAEAAAKGTSTAREAIRVFRHEVGEFFKANEFFTPKEWKLLQETARKKGWVETTGVRQAYEQLYKQGMTDAELSDVLTKEAIFEQYSEFHLGNKSFEKPVKTLFQRFKDYLTRITNWMRGQGFQTWEDVFTKIDQGEFKQRYEQAFGTPQEATATPQTGIANVVRAGQLQDAPGFTPSLPADQTVIGLSEHITALREALGMTVRQGRLDPNAKRAARAAGGELGGHFNRETGVTRLAVSNSIDDLAHEGGHHLESLYKGELDALKQRHAAELISLATPGPDALSEGFADFFRRYVTNPTVAQQKAPNFYKNFESFIESKSPDTLTKLQGIQQAYTDFLRGDPTQVKKANQTVLKRRENQFTRFLGDAEKHGVRDTLADRLHVMYFNMVASSHGWWLATKKALDLIALNTGKRVDIKAVDNPNKLLRRISHTNAWAMQDLKRGIAMPSRPEGGGVSMHDVLTTAFGGGEKSQWNEEATKDFGDYLISRSAINRYIRHAPQLRNDVIQFIQAHPNELGHMMQRLPVNTASTIENAPTLEPLNYHLQSLLQHEQRSPQYRQAAEMYYQFNKDVVQFLHEKGLLSDEHYQALQEDTDYAPFQRDRSDIELASGSRPSRRGGGDAATANKYDVFKAFKGSTRDIINPIQSTVQFVYEMRLRAALNDTLVAMDKLAKAAGPGGGAIFERLPAREAVGYTVDIQEGLKKLARDAGLSETDTAYMLGNVEQFIGKNATATLFTQQLTKERGERIVWFYENGKPVPARLADGTLGRMMFEGFTGMGQRAPGWFLNIISLPATAVRFGVTNAIEFIGRNIFVDALTAPINSPYATFGVTQISGSKEILSDGKYMELYNRYAGMMGGEMTAALTDQSIQRDIEALRVRGFKIRRPKTIREFLKFFAQTGEFSETATRVGVFKKAYESALADGLTPYEAGAEAAYASHDVMDFSRHGSKTEIIRRSTPFWNAGLIGTDRYARSLTAQGDHGSAIRTYLKYRDGKALTPSEKKDLKQAVRAWGWSTLILGGMSYLFYMLGEDDEDMDEIGDRLRATHWRVSVDGVLHLIPKDMRTFLDLPDDSDVVVRLPKPFEIAWFANAVERGLDAAKKGDPTAFRRYVSDLWEITHPPSGMPVLDVPYEIATGKSLFTGRPIIPQWDYDIERAEQYGPYTSETARRIGKLINVSPFYVDHVIRSVGASVARDAQTVIDFAAGKGPKPRIEEYPVARRFTYNTGRFSHSLEGFYNKMSDKEGINSWFWDLVSKDARSFNSARNTYRRFLKNNNDAAASDFYETLNDDQKVFAVLGAEFQKTRSKYRNLHPMINAEEGIRVIGSLMREVYDGELKVGKKQTPLQLNRQEMQYARNELGHIRKGFAQNALHIVGAPGWANMKMVDVDRRLETLKAGSPKVYDEMMRRLVKEKFIDFKTINKVWPEVKRRVLEKKKNASLGDLYQGRVHRTYSVPQEETAAPASNPFNQLELAQ